jgi:hypothetical protein
MKAAKEVILRRRRRRYIIRGRRRRCSIIRGKRRRCSIIRGRRSSIIKGIEDVVLKVEEEHEIILRVTPHLVEDQTPKLTDHHYWPGFPALTA